MCQHRGFRTCRSLYNWQYQESNDLMIFFIERGLESTILNVLLLFTSQELSKEFLLHYLLWHHYGLTSCANLYHHWLYFRCLPSFGFSIIFHTWLIYKENSHNSIHSFVGEDTARCKLGTAALQYTVL